MSKSTSANKRKVKKRRQRKSGGEKAGNSGNSNNNEGPHVAESDSDDIEDLTEDEDLEGHAASPHPTEDQSAAASTHDLAVKQQPSRSSSSQSEQANNNNNNQQQQQLGSELVKFETVYKGGNSHHEARNLDPATTYLFRVSAANAAGTSEWSTETAVDTPPAPPATITNIR